MYLYLLCISFSFYIYLPLSSVIFLSFFCIFLSLLSKSLSLLFYHPISSLLCSFSFLCQAFACIHLFSLYLTLFLLFFSLSACITCTLTEIPFPCSIYLHFYSNTVYQINSKLASDPVWELAKPRKPQTKHPPTEYTDCLKAAAIPSSNIYTRKCAYSQDNIVKQNHEKLSLWGVLKDRFPTAQSSSFSYCILNMHPGSSMV
jgi:hypothetical protein